MAKGLGLSLPQGAVIADVKPAGRYHSSGQQPADRRVLLSSCQEIIAGFKHGDAVALQIEPASKNSVHRVRNGMSRLRGVSSAALEWGDRRYPF
jgi:hypothetical protein